MNKRIQIALKFLSTIIIAVAIVFVFLLHGLKLFGLTPYCVLSGSMQSVYPTGSVIYVSKVNPEILKENDIITFKMTNGTVATHRIIELVHDKHKSDVIRFRTKGDENQIADGSLVDFSNVIGKPVFCIPLLGYFITFISSPLGKCIAVCTIIAFIIIKMMINIMFNEEKRKQQNEKN